MKFLRGFSSSIYEMTKSDTCATEQQLLGFVSKFLHQADRRKWNNAKTQRIIDNPLFAEWIQRLMGEGFCLPHLWVDVSGAIDVVLSDNIPPIWSKLKPRNFQTFSLIDLYINVWQPDKVDNLGSHVFGVMSGGASTGGIKCDLDPSLCGEYELSWMKNNWDSFPTNFRKWATGKLFAGARDSHRDSSDRFWVPTWVGGIQGPIEYAAAKYLSYEAKDVLVLHGC